jgi:hypothetical protein
MDTLGQPSLGTLGVANNPTSAKLVHTWLAVDAV